MIQRFARRCALVCAALTLPSAASAASPGPGCGPAALAGEDVVAWDTASAVTGDFDMDGELDVAYLGRDAEKTMLMIAACRGDEVRQHWLFAVRPNDTCGAPPRLDTASLLLDEDAVAGTCASPTSASECAHLRRTNRERQAQMDAGARALRIAAPGCPGFVVRWSSALGGFTRGPG